MAFSSQASPERSVAGEEGKKTYHQSEACSVPGGNLEGLINTLWGVVDLIVGDRGVKGYLNSVQGAGYGQKIMLGEQL